MSINRQWINNVWYEILLSKKEGTYLYKHEMSRYQIHFVQQKKSDAKDYTLFDSIYMKFWKRLGWGEATVYRGTQQKPLEVMEAFHILFGVGATKVFIIIKTH